MAKPISGPPQAQYRTATISGPPQAQYRPTTPYTPAPAAPPAQNPPIIDTFKPPNQGGGGGATPSLLPTGDYSGLLGIAGLPPDIVAQVNQIFQQAGDVNVGAALALAYIRGTAWYAQTFPGINYGFQAGLFSNESGYRSYVNTVNQYVRQYLNRDVSGSEIGAYLKEGVSPDIVGKRFAGDVIAQTNTPDWNYLQGAFGTQGPGGLSEPQLQAAGREQAGIDTPLGQLINKRLQQASDRFNTIFKGTLATPALSVQGGLNSPSLLGNRQGTDIAR